MKRSAYLNPTEDQFNSRRKLTPGTGKSRKVVDITSSTLPDVQKEALIGVHAFSGNDYISSFCRKGKMGF